LSCFMICRYRTCSFEAQYIGMVKFRLMGPTPCRTELVKASSRVARTCIQPCMVTIHRLSCLPLCISLLTCTTQVVAPDNEQNAIHHESRQWHEENGCIDRHTNSMQILAPACSAVSVSSSDHKLLDIEVMVTSMCP